MMDVSRRGPLYNQSKLVEDVVREHGRVVMATLPEELPVRETVQLWNTMRSDFRPKVLGVIINQWQRVSQTLQEAFNQSDVSNMLTEYPEYQTVLNILKEDHENQNLWQDWLGTQLGTPQKVPILRYDKWSRGTDLPTLDGLEAWL